MTDRWRIIQADIAEYLDGYDGPPFHAVFCDPPYGLGKEPDAAEVLRHWLAGDDFEQTGGGFMSKEWDSFVPGPATWKRIIEHVKPGAPLLAFGGTRTSDLLTMALRLAKFEIRDCLMWLYGQGFPKSHDVSKAIDDAAGAEREVVGERFYAYPDSARPGKRVNIKAKGGYDGGWEGNCEDGMRPVTAPATPEAERWDGYGTALKPSYEPVVLAMKPPDGTFAENALRHGVAGINVDGGRIGTTKRTPASGASKDNNGYDGGWGGGEGRENGTGFNPNQGRWPANVILQHHEDCVQRGVRRVRGHKHSGKPGNDKDGQVYGRGIVFTGDTTCYADADGRETVAAWDCHPDCAVRMLAEMSGESESRASGRNTAESSTNTYGWAKGGIWKSGVHYGDTGTAARFFYQAKAHRRERDAGLAGMPERRRADINKIMGDPGDFKTGSGNQRQDKWRNFHPTVKPITLCKYLATLILPPPGPEPRRLIVPFSGSGSEMIGALLAGWDEVIGVEMVPDYVDIARARVAAWMDAADRLQTTDVDAILDHLGALEKAERERQAQLEAGQLPLFGGAL